MALGAHLGAARNARPRTALRVGYLGAWHQRRVEKGTIRPRLAAAGRGRGMPARAVFSELAPKPR